MSVVQKAFDVQEQRVCAIKRMKTGADEFRNKESFNREYKALSDLGEHPNIVSIYDAGTDDDGFYMVLEWLPENLEQWITKNGKMSWPEFYNRIGRGAANLRAKTGFASAWKESDGSAATGSGSDPRTCGNGRSHPHQEAT